ncbi:HupE/UreJ family protein [Aeromonas sanarellii]|nr:HupE/UreJ family protein [Aeromonas sanarellii]
MTTAIVLMLLATPAFAHTGHMEHGFSSGVLHPLTVTVHRQGLDAHNSEGMG